LLHGPGLRTRQHIHEGSLQRRFDPKDWNNKLTVTGDAITLELKDGVKVEIPSKSVTSLSYGQEAHRRVGTMVALAILVAPVALFGLFHKTRLHYIGIQYNSADTKNAGILLQGDKDNYRAILVALQGVTGAAVSVGDKDREFVPVGLTTSVTKQPPEPEGDKSSGQPSARTAPSPDAAGTVSVSTDPNGAEVYSDDEFHGNSPVTLKLKPGKHTIRVKMSGYKDWSRDMSVDAGSDAHLAASLEKQN
jgi:PEGA domain